jgi:hypothetical protein
LSSGLQTGSNESYIHLCSNESNVTGKIRECAEVDPSLKKPAYILVETEISGGKKIRSQSRKRAIIDINSEDGQLEVHLLAKTLPLDIVLMFEGVPVWLLGLEPSRVSNIYILGHLSRSSLVNWLDTRKLPRTIIVRLLARFGSGRIKFCPHEEHPSINGLTLVSGSIH